MSRKLLQILLALLGLVPFVTGILTMMGIHTAKKIEQEVDCPPMLRQAPPNETVSHMLSI